MANGRNSTRRSSRKHLTGPKTDAFFVDASGIDGIADMLDQMGEAVRDAIRPVAQAGAQVFYDRVKANVAAMGRVTGNLNNAIYQKYVPEYSEDGKKAIYRVSWNVIKAPHGRLLEHGYMQRYARYVGKDGNWYTDKKKPLKTPKQVPGKFFVARARAAAPEAMAAMQKELASRLEALYYGGA